MPYRGEGTPSAQDVVDYLQAYEQRYQLDVQRPIRVSSVTAGNDVLIVHTERGDWSAPAVVSTTGTLTRPEIPVYPGCALFAGTQIHSSAYRGPGPFAGKRVLVVGGGNSGAQIYAELTQVAHASWVTLDEPRFLPDDVDGRVLFERATERWRAQKEGRPFEEINGGLGDIVMVPPVKEARERGVLATVRPFDRLVAHGVVWRGGQEEAIDAIIWCTGFLPALEHLRSLGIVAPTNRVRVTGTRSLQQPRLWLVGYGEWTGMASATLIGVMRTARSTASEVGNFLEGKPSDVDFT